ncbi:hypothetical protein PVL29_017633 [Vitis rotundifolia]|uniref:Uncharacterized protein n=1 Tax=Vitis rotundifolia TaxID=103349 RepID=A0AA39DIX4_VITRO|nr:hypothetical protein PVL29_017633 [Vitis rotundifolia]
MKGSHMVVLVALLIATMGKDIGTHQAHAKIQSPRLDALGLLLTHKTHFTIQTTIILPHCKGMCTYVCITEVLQCAPCSIRILVDWGLGLTTKIFYERLVGHIAHMEEYLANSAETMSALQSLKEQYRLIVVDQGVSVNTVLTARMNVWMRCPELGPIGDFLLGSDSVVSASIMITHTVLKEN